MKHACLICGEERRLLLFSVRDFFSFHRYAVAECQGCAFAETIIPEQSEVVYDVYGVRGARFGGGLQGLAKSLYALRMKRVRHLKPGTLIDVGSGHGEFLQAMVSKGWKGVEIDRYNQSDFLSDKHQASATLVTFWHSLEHFERPDEFLKAAYQALKPGGTLLIEVPNFSSFQSWWAENRWLHLDCPRHRYHFTPEALKRLVEQSHFRVQSISTWSCDVGLWGSLQAWLDHFGEAHFLYRVIQPESRKKMSLFTQITNGIWTCLLLPLVAPLAIVSEIAAAVFRRGGVIRLVGVKP